MLDSLAASLRMKDEDPPAEEALQAADEAAALALQCGESADSPLR